jgi:transcriptional regulator with GAF, ATPase, and Fis domain
MLLVDEERRVRAVNDVLERALGVPANRLVGQRGGGALGCIYARRNESCGEGEECRTCEARQAAEAALREGKVQRTRAHFQVALGGKVQELELHLSASPLVHRGRRYVLVLIEDLSRLVRLRLASGDEGFHGMIGKDAQMEGLFENIRTVARLPVPVLVHGESGVGKELVAVAIHRESARASRHIVPVNCGVLTDGLLESELFGHVRGAFTGAIRDKKGRFELADGGTIFLDEIGELSPAMQVKLLRVLQDGSFERVGGERTSRVDARVICATNRNLEREVAEGRFRADLYYRLSVVPILVPPLRHRRGDIPVLANHFLAKICAEHGHSPVGLTDPFLERLQAHDWPGNVRELENALHFALVQSKGADLEVRHLPAAVRGPAEEQVLRGAVRHREPLKRLSVTEALLSCGGNKVLAARRLGVSRATLYRFLERNA